MKAVLTQDQLSQRPMFDDVLGVFYTDMDAPRNTDTGELCGLEYQPGWEMPGMATWKVTFDTEELQRVRKRIREFQMQDFGGEA